MRRENDVDSIKDWFLSNYSSDSCSIGLRRCGGEIDPNDVSPGSVLEDINTTTEPGFPDDLRHGSIDDNAQVRQRILTNLNSLMLR